MRKFKLHQQQTLLGFNHRRNFHFKLNFGRSLDEVTCNTFGFAIFSLRLITSHKALAPLHDKANNKIYNQFWPNNWTLEVRISEEARNVCAISENRCFSAHDWELQSYDLFRSMLLRIGKNLFQELSAVINLKFLSHSTNDSTSFTPARIVWLRALFNDK